MIKSSGCSQSSWSNDSTSRNWAVGLPWPSVRAWHTRGSPTPSAGSKIRSGPQQRETQSEVAASLLPSRGPKRGRKCYVTPAFSGIPNAKHGEQNRSGCLTPAFSGAKKRAEMLCHPCILGDPQHRGTKSEVATSPLPSRGPKRGRKCYVIPAFSGIPNAKREEQNQKWSPTKGNTIRSARLTRASSGAQMRAEMLHHPCILGDPQHRGTKSEVATSPLPSRGPKRGWKCYATPAFSRIPNAKRGEQNQKWFPAKGNKIRSSKN